jgi:hypothetical protein
VSRQIGCEGKEGRRRPDLVQFSSPLHVAVVQVREWTESGRRRAYCDDSLANHFCCDTHCRSWRAFGWFGLLSDEEGREGGRANSDLEDVELAIVNSDLNNLSGRGRGDKGRVRIKSVTESSSS